MKNSFKILTGFLLGVFLTFANIINVNAASANISVSSSTSKIVLGNTFTVTVKISSSNALGSWEWVINYDTGKFKLMSGDSYVADYASGSSVKSKTYTYKFKAVGTGSGTIGVKSYGAYEWNETKLSISAGSKTVKVITQAEQQESYSKNNNLSSLSIDGLTLTPEFSKDVTEYTAEAGANTESINIVAKKSDSKASVSGTGKIEVSEGENKLKVVVTAENGSTKTYNITVNVTDPNPIVVKDTTGEELTIIKRAKNLEAPTNYESKEITIDEQTVPAFYNESNGFTLVGLKNAEGDSLLYIYNDKDNTYTHYSETTLNQMKIFPLPIEKKFDETYNSSDIKINDVTFPAMISKKSNITIIHAIDLNTGKDNYYVYDSETNTVIKYNDKEIKILKDEVSRYYNIVIILCVETFIMFIILICVLISRIKRNKRRKLRYLESSNNTDEKLTIEKEVVDEQNENIDLEKTTPMEIVNEVKEVLSEAVTKSEKYDFDFKEEDITESKREYKARIKKERKEAKEEEKKKRKEEKLEEKRLKKESKYSINESDNIKENEDDEETTDIREEIKQVREKQKEERKRKKTNHEEIVEKEEESTDQEATKKRFRRKKSLDEQLDQM